MGMKGKTLTFWLGHDHLGAHVGSNTGKDGFNALEATWKNNWEMI